MHQVDVRMERIKDVAVPASFFIKGRRRGLVPAKRAPGRFSTSLLASSLRSFSRTIMDIMMIHSPAGKYILLVLGAISLR
jgi:hypothetical protein